MGDDLEQALKGKTLADIIHALPCDHPIQVEIDRLKEELEEARREVDYQVQENLTIKAHLKRQLDTSQALLAEARSSGYWYERYKSCAEHLHLYTDGEEHGTADSCSFCTVVAEINGKLTEVQRQLAEARADNDRLFLENRRMLQGMKWDNQLKAEARQEAARECRDAVYKLYTDWQKRQPRLHHRIR